MKRRVIIFVLVSLLIVQCLVGCRPNANTPQPSAAVSAEPTPVTKAEDRKTVIATVNGVPLYKGDFLDQFNRAVITYQLQEYDFTQDTEEVAELKSTLISEVYEGLIAVEVCRQLADKGGFMTLTDAEKAQVVKELDEISKEDIDAKVEEIRESYADKTEAELREIAVDLFYESIGLTYEFMLNEQLLNKGLGKYQDSIIDSVTVSDKQILDKYNEIREAQAESFKENYSVYETAIEDGQDEDGNPICYNLPNYRWVQSLLIAISDEDMDEIDTLESEEKTEEAAAKQKAALKKIESKAKSALAKAKTKKTTADFAALIKEYGEDPGMSEDESRKQGYLVSADSTTWVEEFVDGAMSMNKEGDISDIVPSGYGYFILRLRDKIDPGYVPLVEVKHQIKKMLLEELQGKKWDTHLENIVEKAEIVRYEDRLTILNYAE